MRTWQFLTNCSHQPPLLCYIFHLTGKYIRADTVSEFTGAFDMLTQGATKRARFRPVTPVGGTPMQDTCTC